MGLLQTLYSTQYAPSAWQSLAFGQQPQQPLMPLQQDGTLLQRWREQNSHSSGPRDLDGMRAGLRSAGPNGGAMPSTPLAALTGARAAPQLGPEWQTPAALPTPPALPQGAAAMTAGGKQAAPFDATARQFQPGTASGFWGNLQAGLNDLPNNRLLQTGLSLMGHAQGSRWDLVAQDLAQQGRDQRERQAFENEQRRQKVADARDSEQWTWAQQERQRTGDRRRLAEDYINSRPEAERAELRMIDPDELGGYIQQQRQFDLQLQEMRDNRAFRAASLNMDRQRLEQDRILNSASSVLGREEAQRLGADMQRLRGWSMIDNDMAALEEILDRNPAAFNNLFDADVEQALARVRDPQTRRDVQTIYSLATSMAREELRGQTPVSNIDLLSAVRSAPNPSSGAGFARDWLNRAYQDRADLEGYVQGAINYMQQPDGSRRTLFEPDPATGRNFYQSDAFRRYTGNGSFTDVRGDRRSRQDSEAQSAAAALAERRARGATTSAGYGHLGGAAGAPRLLREPNAYEATIVRQYQEAQRANNQNRVRTLEVRMRQRGLIP
ncbi:MAG TPA: hypothetical protein VEA80_04840 [Vitreimonas sp.]|uniref:hypothetical protein n=1 Tax=Vitreimonas sp. TaxID=3069702 RepID=UPI002D5A7440|nr:hypothetical protein [Vitreimonas sp.]HYD86778.1 hypothetical protein [Vitreimonas sp.]